MGPHSLSRADAAVAVRSGVIAVVDVAAVQEAVVLAVGGDEPAEAAWHSAIASRIRLLGLHALAVVGEGA